MLSMSTKGPRRRQSADKGAPFCRLPWNSGRRLLLWAKRRPRQFTLGSKPVVEITAVTATLVQPNLIGTLLDFSAQIWRHWKGQVAVCFLSRSIFHCAVLSVVFRCFVSLITFGFADFVKSYHGIHRRMFDGGKTI